MQMPMKKTIIKPLHFPFLAHFPGNSNINLVTTIILSHKRIRRRNIPCHRLTLPGLICSKGLFRFKTSAFRLFSRSFRLLCPN